MRSPNHIFSTPWLCLALALAALVPVPAAAAVQVAVNGNTATADIQLAGNLDADLTLSFDSSSNLSAANLGIQATVVSPLDATLQGRLPGANLNTITNAFPVLITVAPPSSGQLQFTNSARVELHTHALQYTSGTRLRLFKAEIGGAFRDITETVESGSIRARGRTGGFSQFLIVLDNRSTSQVVQTKLDALDDIIDSASAALSPASAGLLQNEAAAVHQAVQNNDLDGALDALDTLNAQVVSLAGSGLPNVWQAGGTQDNIAGRMLAQISTLEFSLRFQRDYGD